MKYSIRQRVVNQYGLFVTKVESVNGELGSGIADINGKEIFEGDIVKFEDGETFTVTFKDGAFYIGDDILGDFCILPEVVGCVEG